MFTFRTAAADSGRRLDHYLNANLNQYSRSRIQGWIRDGRVRVNGLVSKSSFILRGNEQIEVQPAEQASLKAVPEALPLDIIYTDDDIIAVNKPAGLVVHAGAGQHSGTLVNALLHHFQSLSSVSGDDRPGIVHRIDRDTSGVLLVARTDVAHRHLAEQFASRRVEKVYLALVQGNLKQVEGRVDSPITRDPVRRSRMTARQGKGRTALTYYRILERLRGFTYLEVRIGTGRTHQIRVHLASLGHPVAGDKLYGAADAGRGRFFLHAHRIVFESPSTGAMVKIEADLPPDLERWLEDIRASGPAQ